MTAALKPRTLGVLAHREKDGSTYTKALGESHRRVLAHLARWEFTGKTDAELTMALQMQNAGARRCELRDAGCIRRGNRRKGAWVWLITSKGQGILGELNGMVAE